MNIYKTLEKNYIKYGNVKINVIIDKNDDLWFNAKNTAIALGYKDLKKSVKMNVYKRDISQIRDIEYDNNYIKEHPQTLYITEAGLYRLMLRSRLPAAEDFTDWVTHDVLPSIRKYGSYKLKKKYEEKLNTIMNKINYLRKENTKMKNDLKKEIYPKGGVVYIVKYSDENKNAYRLGMTTNMKIRKKLYDTHSLHKRKVVLIQETKQPIQLETCIRAMLYDYRYKNKKDFYLCGIRKITNAFKICSKSIANMNRKNGSKTQKGGGNNIIGTLMNKLNVKKQWLKKRINQLGN